MSRTDWRSSIVKMKNSLIGANDDWIQIAIWKHFIWKRKNVFKQNQSKRDSIILTIRNFEFAKFSKFLRKLKSNRWKPIINRSLVIFWVMGKQRIKKKSKKNWEKFINIRVFFNR